MAIEIFKDSNIVDVVVAQARGERVDSDVAEKAAAVIKDLAATPNPNNLYQIGQLIGFGVNEITRNQTNWLDNIADVKRVGFGQKAQFKVKNEGIRAFIQAKGATTARTKVANKTITLDTIAVSARPVINIVELQNGMVNMADLINDAAFQMECAENGYFESVLLAGATSWSAPYYGTGSGIVKATIDPMIYHWMRISGGIGATILGDAEEIAKLSELTGFTASASAKQFSDDIINEHNANGFIGRYIGANVVNMINPIKDGGDTPVFDTKKLFILPNAISADMRPLKVVFEGDVVSEEARHIDDKSYEVRLDQYFNAALVYGDRPYISVYADSAT